MAARTLTDEQVTIAGTTIPLRRGGQGRPLLFLNGGDGFHRSERWLGLLAGSYDVYAPKHPGYGGAPFAPHIRSVDELALFYLELLERFKLTDVVLVGASFGGWVATEVAVRSCDRLSCLALIDSLGVKFGGPCDEDIADIYVLPPEEVKRRQYFDGRDRDFDYSSLSDEQATTIIRDREGEAYYGWKPYMHNPTLRHWLWRIRTPTVVLWGAGDGIVSPDYGRALAAEIEGSVFRTIERAGHYPHVENPEQVLHELNMFLSSRAASSGRPNQ